MPSRGRVRGATTRRHGGDAAVRPRLSHRLCTWTARVVSLAILLTGLFAALPSPALADPWYRPSPILGVVDAGRQLQAAHKVNVGWDRIVFLWQEIQPHDPTDWYLDRYLDQFGLRKQLESGLPLIAVVQGTPGWAAGDWRDGAAGVPTGLNYAVENKENNFGRFMLRLASTFKGRIHAWVIWNEPDFRPGDSGSWWTWAGNTEDFFKVVRTGYQAVKKADPNALVVFPATTYFVDVVNQRELFLSRVLVQAAKDPEAVRHGFYFDAVAVNLYCSPDMIYRAYGLYAEVLARFKLVKPIWLTETNCPAYNDATRPVDPMHHVSTSEQAAYVIQALAMARAAGYQRIGWFSMMDHDPRRGITDQWGLLRADGTRRPAFEAFQVAAKYLGRPEQSARFAPIGEGSQGGWPVYRVVLDDGVRRRVQVLWRGKDGPMSIRLEALGPTAQIVDMLGQTSRLERQEGWWHVHLPPPRVAQPFDPPGYPEVGDPVLLVETGLPPVRSLAPPRARF
jgi:hypothetical protein